MSRPQRQRQPDVRYGWKAQTSHAILAGGEDRWMRTILMIPVLAIGLVSTAFAQDRPRARDLGATFEGQTGPLNAITDVPGVLVGQTTFISGEGKHAVRTGVTAINPRKELGYFPAAVFTLTAMPKCPDRFSPKSSGCCDRRLC